MKKIVVLLACLLLVSAVSSQAAPAKATSTLGQLQLPKRGETLNPPSVVKEKVVYIGDSANATTVGGQIFFRYLEPSANPGTAKPNFDIDRAYVDIKHKIDHGGLVRVTLDVARLSTSTSTSSVTANTTTQQLFDYLKYAYVELPSDFGVTAKLGLQQTVWIDWSDKMMGLRYITKGIVDNEGLMPSADMGVSALGKAYLPYLRPIEYQATFMNGAGFKAAESDNKKNVAMRLNTVLWSGNEIGELLLGGYAQVSGISATKWEGETKLAGAMLGLKNSWSTVYGEYLYGTNLSGFSVGAKYSFLPSYNVFARYDSYDAKRDVANNEIQRGFYGLTYDYSSDVKFALDLQSVYGQANATVSAGTTTSIIYLHCLMNY